MRNKISETTKTLTGIALGLQIVAIIVTLLVVTFQKSIKGIFGGSPQILEIVTFPVAHLIIVVCPAIFYLILLVLVQAMENKKSMLKTLAVILFGVLCFANIVLDHFLPMVETSLVARSGAEKLASLSILNSAVSMITSPFSTVAFGLFAIAVGASISCKEDENTLLSDSVSNKVVR